MVAYILFDPALHALIREEVRPAVKPDGINMHFLVNNCPQLQSVFYEAMRLTKRDIGIRKVVRPTLLGGKLLSSGNAVILATCQLHENRDIFSFIAFLFHRWDIELASTAGKDKTSDGKQTFPVADDSTITLGITLRCRVKTYG